MAKTRKKQSRVEILNRERLWDGFIKIDQITANIPTKTRESLKITREIHDHGNCVVILPVDMSREKALMISQWRLPTWINGYRERLWEAPAGLLEDGEAPEECAKREALEETGYDISNLRLVGTPFVSPGLVTERAYIFLGDYTPTTKQTSRLGVEEEGEDILLKEYSFKKLFKMLNSGQLHDATTMIAVYALQEEIRNKD